MRTMLARWAGGCAALVVALALAGPAAAQERFDLRDWTRKPLPKSPTVLFECSQAARCGAGSIVSGRLIDKPSQPITLERQKQREAQTAKRMREQSDGRIKDVQVGETRELKVEQMTFFVTEKKVVAASGGTRFFVDGVMVGKANVYSVVASGAKEEQVRNNFNAFALVAAVVLIHAANDADDDDEKPKPAPATPAPAPTPPTPAPSPK